MQESQLSGGSLGSYSALYYPFLFLTFCAHSSLFLLKREPYKIAHCFLVRARPRYSRCALSSPLHSPLFFSFLSFRFLNKQLLPQKVIKSLPPSLPSSLPFSFNLFLFSHSYFSFFSHQLANDYLLSSLSLSLSLIVVICRQNRMPCLCLIVL